MNKFLVEIKDRIFKPSNEFEFNRKLDLLDGKKITIELKAFRKLRSLPQNKYYWKCLIEMLFKFAETGYTRDEFHEMLKLDCLGQYEKSGRVFIKSTTGLTTAEFEDFLVKAREWARYNCNLIVPLPNEYCEYVNRGDLPPP